MNMQRILVLVVICTIILSAGAFAAKPKVLYIDSYHEGYAWSDGITNGIKTKLGDAVELKIHRMDTKRNGSDEFKKAAALKAKELIDTWQPDVVIASDDNAAKFLIKPYYADKELPFVFCGLNWDASVYGFPTPNVTGMVEVALYEPVMKQLRPLAAGTRVGMIAPDLETSRKEEANIEKAFNVDLVTYYAKDFEDWKKGFVEVQNKCDILIVASDGGLYKDHAAAMKTFVEANTKVPSASFYDFMAPYALMSFAKVAEEQGLWSAETALAILDGKKPSDIPVVQNTKGKIFVNTTIMKALKVRIPLKILKKAEKIK